MNNSTNRLPKRNVPDGESIYNKYASLIHILNGEEEFMLDRNGFIVGSNLEAVNVTGYEEFEIMGKHISIFYRPEEHEKAIADLEKASRLGSSIVTGLRVKKRSVNFWAKMKIKFLHSAQSGSPCFKVILQDTTHRALSKERIRTLKDEYLSLFNNPFVGTFKFKMDGYGIQMCNQKTLEFLGISNSANLRFDSFFASLHQFEQFISQLQEDKKVEGFKFKVQNGNACQENWAIISARYFEAHGFAEGVLFDITEQYNQMMELQRVNTELDNFIYHASHDLRSPLTSIMGLVNLGLNENSVEVVNTYLKMIQDRIHHLDILLKDLISVSYNNEIQKEYEPFHFEEEINSILVLLKNPDQKIKVNVDVTQQSDFKTDPIRVRTILRNLLSNSFKYCSPETPAPFIHINVRVRPSHCAILLRDNGIGIHQNFKSRIYEMFFRATERSAGSGLGLYIVKSMVEKLKGRISFESTLNVGTTFLLTIPNQTTSIVSLNLNHTSDHFMLTSKQIELVENSWDYVLLNSQETGAVFYKKLFEIDPGLRQLFKGEIHAQSQKLVAMITFAVHKLNNLNEIIADVKTLGVHHHQNSVKPEHYASVAVALLWTIENALGKEWNNEIKEAWMAVYTALAKTMIGAQNNSVL